MTSEHLAICSGGLGPIRGREAPCTPRTNLLLSNKAFKSRLATSELVGSVVRSNALICCERHVG